MAATERAFRAGQGKIKRTLISGRASRDVGIARALLGSRKRHSEAWEADIKRSGSGTEMGLNGSEKRRATCVHVGIQIRSHGGIKNRIGRINQGKLLQLCPGNCVGIRKHIAGCGVEDQATEAPPGLVKRGCQ